MTTSPQRGAPLRSGRRPQALFWVTGTTAETDRILIGDGITDQKKASEMARDWSRAIRYRVTSVRSTPWGDPIASYADGKGIPVPRAEREPDPRDWHATMTAITQPAADLQALAEPCAVLSEAQAAALDDGLLTVENACRTVRSARTRAYRDAATGSRPPRQPPRHDMQDNQDLEAGA